MTFSIADNGNAGEITSGNSAVLQVGTPSLVAGSLNLYDVPFAMQFKQSDVTNATEFTQLFEYYRIRNVMIKMGFNGTSTYLGGSPVPTVEYITDHNDATLILPENLEQKMGIKSKTFGARNAVWLGVNPKVPAALASGQETPAIVAPVDTRRSPWISSQFPNIQHYGIKGVIRNCYLPPSVSNSFVIRVECIYDVEYKGVE